MKKIFQKFPLWRGLFSTEILISSLLLVVNAAIVVGWLTDNVALKHPFDGPAVGPGSVLCAAIVAVLLIVSPIALKRPRIRVVIAIGSALLITAIILKGLSIVFSLPIMRYVNMYEAINCALAAMGVMILHIQQPYAKRMSQVLGSLIIFSGLVGIVGYIYVLPYAEYFLTFYGAAQSILIGLGVLSLTVYAFRVFKLRIILLGMFLLTALVFTTSATSQRIITDYKAASDKVRHTYEVLQAVDDLRIELAESESSQRGYFISGDKDYLEPYQRNITRIDSTIKKLESLIKDNPKQVEYQKTLATLFATRKGQFATSISYYMSGQMDVVYASIKARTGKKVSDQIYIIFNAIEAEERRLLELRTNTLDLNAEAVGFIRIVSTSVGVLLLLVVVISVIRSMRKLDESQQILKKANNELSIEKARIEALLDSIGDGVFALNMQGEIILFNPQAEYITGMKAAHVLQQPYTAILQFVDAKTGVPRDAFIQKALRGQASTIPKGVELVLRDGTRMPVADSAAPIRDNTHQQIGIIVVFRDITKEIALEKSKDDFVSLASHQLRTPLSAIGWYGEMLLNGDAGALTKEQQSYVKEIYDGNARMVDLVNSLLNASRLDLGKLANVPEPVAVEDIVKSLTQELAGAVKEKQLTLTTKLAKRHQHLMADPKLLRMIIQNLLSNAVKYTPEKGTIELVFGQDPKRPRNVQLSVRDTGYGIPVVQQRNIFSKLFRADNVQKLGIEGTGLGLYIVRAAAERMGGKAWFESTEGTGTTFYISFPYKAPTKDNQ